MVSLFRQAAAFALAASTLMLAAPVQAEKVGAYRILPTPEYWAKTGRQAPTAETAGAMLYYGGTVMENAKVVSVMWGPNVPATTVAGIPGFTAAMVNSTYMDPLSQYDTTLNAQDGRPGTQQHIGRGTFVGQVQITPRNTKTTLTNDDIRKELKYQIKTGALPKQNPNMLYMVYFPQGVTITLDGLRSCIDYGAYHFATIETDINKKNIYYSVEPACNYSFNTITYIAAHEFVEAVTDNIPTPGSNPAFPQAWNTSNGYEVADICSASGQLTAGGKSYTVTQYYLNTTAKCSTGNYTSP